MRNLVLSLLIATLIVPVVSQEALASRKARRTYKTYHTIVYYPVLAMTFIAGGIPVLISHINTKWDAHLKENAEAEAK